MERRCGSSRISLSLSAWRERRREDLRWVRAVLAFDSSLPAVVVRARLYVAAKVLVLSSRLGTLFLISVAVRVRVGMDSWRVDSWSEDVVVERWERELRAWRERRLVWVDWVRDWGSVVVRSVGRRERRRERYFERVEVEDVSVVLGWLFVFSVRRSSRSGSAMMAALVDCLDQSR